jgi:hypothetical protein
MNFNELSPILGNYFYHLEHNAADLLEEIGAPKGADYIKFLLGTSLTPENVAKIIDLERETLEECETLKDLAELGFDEPIPSDKPLHFTRWIFTLTLLTTFYVTGDENG